MLLGQSFRRGLLKPSRISSYRSLTTTVLPPNVSLNEEPLLIERGHDVTSVVADRKNLDEPQTAHPHFALSPVFIELSSLLREPDSEGIRGQIAALAPSVFRHPIRRDILHLCVVHHLDGLRQGTAANKSRGEVRGSGAKIRPQKGSGSSRLGDGQSPMLRGGGRAFAKKARDFSTKLPRKVIQMGMRVALSAKVKENSLGVVPSLRWPGVKTKDFAQRISELGWHKTLFVTGLDEVPDTLDRSSRNIQDVDVLTAPKLTVYDAVKWERLVLDLEAVEFYEKMLGKPQIDEEAGLD